MAGRCRTRSTSRPPTPRATPPTRRGGKRPPWPPHDRLSLLRRGPAAPQRASAGGPASRRRKSRAYRRGSTRRSCTRQVPSEAAWPPLPAPPTRAAKSRRSRPREPQAAPLILVPHPERPRLDCQGATPPRTHRRDSGPGGARRGAPMRPQGLVWGAARLRNAGAPPPRRSLQRMRAEPAAHEAAPSSRRSLPNARGRRPRQLGAARSVGAPEICTTEVGNQGLRVSSKSPPQNVLSLRQVRDEAWVLHIFAVDQRALLVLF
mmetsp:Transcript_140073/g.435647  ORF Transcript_140073/g.435647 Transcript_140073/m.435647 type:complete len:262 (-) Transcript_140073:93-878(-)